MNQIVGNLIPIRIGKEIHLVSYISMGEWQTFIEFLQRDVVGALEFLIYCSLHRADSTVERKTIKHLLKKYAASISHLIDIICNISLPKVKIKKSEQESIIDEKETERNTKTVYRILSRMHGWTPQQISNMSPAQIYLYLMGGTTGTGIEKMSSMQYQNFLLTREVRN